jgi:uncharacterized protein YbgA (DUF1722 family)
LGTPRKPIRLVKINGKKSLYQPSSEKDLTEQMTNFIQKFVTSVNTLDGFIFKRDSPSCGIADVRLYHKLGTDSGYQKTSGMFSEGVSSQFVNLVKEDEKRLDNISIREHFLTRIFVLAGLRESISENSIDKLFEFYSKNLLLFLCHDEKLTAELGLLFRTEDNFEILSKSIQNIVYEIISSPVKKTPMIDTFDYMFKHVKSNLSESEKSHYYSLVDDFENDLISHSEISTLLYSWALRYDLKIILEQSIFDPFPKSLLLDLVESKKEYSVL